MQIIALTVQNLTSPMVLFFLLGCIAAGLRSNLNIPQAIAKGVSLYLIMAIGLKGGYSLASHGVDQSLILALIIGIILSFGMPFLAFMLLGLTSSLPAVDRASIAAHYGSISIVTFLAANEVLKQMGYVPDDSMVAVAAAMEVPAILSGLWLAIRWSKNLATPNALNHQKRLNTTFVRDVLLNGSIVMLIGAFIIGALTDQSNMESISPFIIAPFKGILCIFLLDMGLIAGRGLREGWRSLSWPVLLFSLYMPLIGAALALFAGWLGALSVSQTLLLMVLGGSASYIAVPAAMRLALPEASAAVPLTLSLGITFPFNLTLGIPLYLGFVHLVIEK